MRFFWSTQAKEAWAKFPWPFGPRPAFGGSTNGEPVIQQRGRRIKPGHARREQGTTSRNGGTLKKRLTLPAISSLSG